MSVALVFDVETTGIPKARNASFRDLDVYNSARIVSIAWRLIDVSNDCEELHNRYYLVRPDGFDIPEDAIKIHGITQEQAMSDGVMFRQVVDELKQDLERCNVLVAHNISFDINVLRSEFVRLKCQALIDVTFEKQLFCTMKEARARGVVTKFTKLTVLHALLFPGGEPCANAHNAHYDVMYCCDIYKVLHSMPRKENQVPSPPMSNTPSP